MNSISPLYATEPASTVSKQYNFISTQDVINTFEDEGFEVSSVQYPKARKESKMGFNAHLVKMRPAISHYSRHLSGVDFSEEVPEIIIINSHDTTKAFRLGVGFFRFICANGLIAGDFLADTGRLMHKGNAAASVLEYISSFSSNVHSKILQITDMKNTVLSSSDLEEFQGKAASIVHPSLIQSEQLLHIHRMTDKQPTIWNAFNVAQENAMKGNYQITGSNSKLRKARPIKDLTRNIEVNTKLWKLAEEFIVG